MKHRVLVYLGLAAAASPVAADFQFHQVVGRGQMLPTAAGDVPLWGLHGQSSFAALTDDGRVAFGAIGTDVNGPRGYWMASGGTIEALAVTGEPVPGMPGFEYQNNGVIFAPRASGNTVAWSVDVRNPKTATSHRTAWSLESSGPVLLGGPGQSAPLGPGVNFAGFTVPRPMAAGSVLVTGSVTGAGVTPENNTVLWGFTGGAARAVARQGDQAAGAPAGAVYDTLLGVAMDSAGHAVFSGEIAGVSSSTRAAAWRETPGGTELIYRRNVTEAPGFNDGTVFRTVRPTFARSGTLAGLVNQLDGPTITSENRHGVWLWNDGAMQEVLRQGQPIASEPGARTLGTLDGALLRITSTGFMALRAPTIDASSQTHHSILFGTSEGFRPIYDFGTQAPGLPAGVTISSATFGPLNEQGYMVLPVTLEGPGVLPHNDRALYLISSSGELTPIIRTSDLLEYAPGQIGAITDLPFGTTGYGGSPLLNNQNDLLFPARLSGGHLGLFMVRIPTPSTAIILGSALALAGVRRRR